MHIYRIVLDNCRYKYIAFTDMPEKTNVKQRKKEPKKDDNVTSEEDESKLNKRNLKFGPLPSFRNQRTWTRIVLFIGLFTVLHFYKGSNNEKPLAKQNEFFHKRGNTVECSESYSKEANKFKTCTPFKCGRFVTDSLITLTEAGLLNELAKKGLAAGGSNGGASVVDFHSGVLSVGDKFVNLYRTGVVKVTKHDMDFLQMIESKLKHAVAETFQIESDALYLTYPTLFSELTNKEPATIHDEYWHPHIDMVTYDSFFYTTLLYLTDFDQDFKGGRFVFMDKKANYTVEPRKGRVLMFTSGSENEHFVEKVTEGKRYALTVAFTCDPSKKIKNREIKGPVNVGK